MSGRFIVLINTGLRGAILLSKFFFIFVAARYLTLEDLGTYSLLAREARLNRCSPGIKQHYGMAKAHYLGLVRNRKRFELLMYAAHNSERC